MEVNVVGKNRFVELKLGEERQIFNLDLIVRVMSHPQGSIIELINGSEYFSPEKFEDVYSRLLGYPFQ